MDELKKKQKNSQKNHHEKSAKQAKNKISKISKNMQSLCKLAKWAKNRDTLSQIYTPFIKKTQKNWFSILKQKQSFH